METITAVAADLAATPEVGADGSILDHTVIVFIGDNGEPHHATASAFPVALMGGRALGLRTGGRSLVDPGCPQTDTGSCRTCGTRTAI